MVANDALAKRPRAFAMAALIALAALVFPSHAMAEALAATVTHLSGSLSATRNGKLVVLARDSMVMPGDTLSTGDDSWARIAFTDRSEMVLRPKTITEIENYSFKTEDQRADNFALRLVKGGLRMVTGVLGKRSRGNVKITAETSTIGIRGTHFGMRLCKGDCQTEAPSGVSGSPQKPDQTAGSSQRGSGGPGFLKASLSVDGAEGDDGGAWGLVKTDSGSGTSMPGPQVPDGLHVDVASGAVQLSNDMGSVIVGTGQFGYTGVGIPPSLIPKESSAPVFIPKGISVNRKPSPADCD